MTGDLAGTKTAGLGHGRRAHGHDYTAIKSLERPDGASRDPRSLIDAPLMMITFMHTIAIAFQLHVRACRARRMDVYRVISNVMCYEDALRNSHTRGIASCIPCFLLRE